MGDFNGFISSFAAGQIPTDDEWSSISAMVDALTSAWVPYTPAWTATGTQPVLSNGTMAGAYTRSGKLGLAKMTLVMGGSTTFGTGVYGFGLPTGWVAGSTLGQVANSGPALFRDNSAASHFAGSCLVSGGASSFEIRVHGANQVGPTTPFTWASNDFIEAFVALELA